VKGSVDGLRWMGLEDSRLGGGRTGNGQKAGASNTTVGKDVHLTTPKQKEGKKKKERFRKKKVRKKKKRVKEKPREGRTRRTRTEVISTIKKPKANS